MITAEQFSNKKAMVIGACRRAQAAGALLRRLGAEVSQVRTDPAQIEAALVSPFDLAVAGPEKPLPVGVAERLRQRNIPIISELELGYRHVSCLNLAITGTNGKSSLAHLIKEMLAHAHRKTIVAGGEDMPICAVTEDSRDLDYLTLRIHATQLQWIEFFRPSVAVLMNLSPAPPGRFASGAEHAKTTAKVFQNQQAFDWAIIQSEALAQLRLLDAAVPSKLITFSANNRRADLYLDRGLLISRLPDWTGPLLDMDHCKLRGPHAAENLMAALALGHVLRLSLDQMTGALKQAQPLPHRTEVLAEVAGVQFVNDAKAKNLDAAHKAIESIAPRTTEPNILLIAGGQDEGFDYHDLGPLLARRVKQAFILGEVREKLRGAWGLFTPCALPDSMQEAVELAFEAAAPGDAVLFSPASSRLAPFASSGEAGEAFREAVNNLAKKSRAKPEPGENDRAQNVE